jgi:hypothetical protein
MISVSAVCIRYATGFGSSAVVARDLEVHLRRVEVAEDSFVRANGRDQAFALDRVFAQRDVGTIVMVTSLAAPVGDARNDGPCVPRKYRSGQRMPARRRESRRAVC